MDFKLDIQSQDCFFLINKGVSVQISGKYFRHVIEKRSHFLKAIRHFFDSIFSHELIIGKIMFQHKAFILGSAQWLDHLCQTLSGQF